MVSKNTLDPTTNPIELLDRTLEQSWETLCATYDVDTDLPNAQNLFTRAALKTPPKAAETVLVNMLMEVIENVGRFSPWYKQPARAFGLVSLGLIMGLFGLGEAFASALGSYFAGLIFDIVGHYHPAFWTGIFLSVAGIVLAGLLKPLNDGSEVQG